MSKTKTNTLTRAALAVAVFGSVLLLLANDTALANPRLRLSLQTASSGRSGAVTHQPSTQEIKPKDGSQPKPPKLYLEGFHSVEVADRGGTFVVLRFRSTKPAIPYVALSTQKVNVAVENGRFQITNPGSVQHSVLPLTDGERTEHKVVVMNLRPNTSYYVRILGYGSQAKMLVPGYVKFSTLHRLVKVQFKKIQMIDDSDDLGDGEFRFAFFVNPEEQPHPGLPYPNLPFLKTVCIGSGSNKSMSGVEKTVRDPSGLTLVAVGLEDDDDAGKSSYGSLLTADAGSGENDEQEWTTGKKNVGLQNVTQASSGNSYRKTETYEQDFSMNCSGYPYGVDLKFKVLGKVNVWYE